MDARWRQSLTRKEIVKPGRLSGDTKIWPENGLRPRSIPGRPDFRFNKTQLGFHPRATSGNVARTWLLMDAPFAARLPLEMLHRVRDVNLLAINPDIRQRSVSASFQLDRRTVCPPNPRSPRVVLRSSLSRLVEDLRQRLSG